MLNIFSKKKYRSISIISDDCWGGEVYKKIKQPFNSPFIGVFINPEDYIRLLSKLEFYLSQPLRFIDSNKIVPGHSKPFPIAFLGDVEINFMHYSNESEAKDKWERRVSRINFNNLYYKIDFCRPGPYGQQPYSKEDIIKWNELALPRSIALHQSDLFVHNGFKLKQHFSDAVINFNHMYKYFNLKKWLNA